MSHNYQRRIINLVVINLYGHFFFVKIEQTFPDDPVSSAFFSSKADFKTSTSTSNRPFATK